MKRNGTTGLILRYMRGSMGFFLVTFLLLIGDMASHLLPPFFQQVFKPLVRKERKEKNITLYLQGDEEKKTDKATRIEANLEPMNREGNLILNVAERDNPHMRELEDQFKLFTMNMKYPADGPDAVEGGNRKIDQTAKRAERPVTVSRHTASRKNPHRL